MNHREFLEIMAVLEAGSGTSRPISEIQAEVYFDLLKDLPADAVRRAARQALAESQYPTIPPVGVLRRLAGAGKVDSESRSLVAYQAAAKAVRTAGAFRSIEFDDPLIHATIMAMGGWERFCDWSPSELQWRQRDFERYYRAFSMAGVSGDECARIPGICERENNAEGFSEHDPEPAFISSGLNPTPGLIRGEVPRRVAQLPDPVGKLVKCLSFPDDAPQPNPEVRPISEAEFLARKVDAISRLKLLARVPSAADGEF